MTKRLSPSAQAVLATLQAAQPRALMLGCPELLACYLRCLRAPRVLDAHVLDCADFWVAKGLRVLERRGLVERLDQTGSVAQRWCVAARTLLEVFAREEASAAGSCAPRGSTVPRF